ncbi:MAG: HAD-IA family hydrolase [Candidatus Saccharibacteria bacterium]
MLKPIKGIVFDFDGVIVDSEYYWPEIESKFLFEHTIGWKEEYYTKLLTGKSLPEAHKLLVNDFSLKLTYDEYLIEYSKMAINIYRNIAKPINGLIDVLDFLGKKSIKLAIASSSKRSWIELSLKTHDLLKYFDVIVSSLDIDVENGKPSPDVYLLAAKRLGESTDALIAIEDSKSGVLSSKSAGIYCIGLNNGFNNNQDISESDIIINGYGEDMLNMLGAIL